MAEEMRVGVGDKGISAFEPEEAGQRKGANMCAVWSI